MFFNSLAELPALARKTNFAIFAINPFKAKIELNKAFKSSALFLEPDEKTGKISVEMVRDFTNKTLTTETTDRFFVVLNAETMNDSAENAFLKNLEEPKNNHHFVLLTKTPSALLPTILSRAQVFFLKETDGLKRPVEVSEKTRTLARELLVADSKKLIAIASDLAKKKDNPRGYALEVVGAAIEITYKSYFATGQENLLKKLKKFLALYENLEKNGHIKLHIVADML
ncbi:hypothetical protein IKE71_00950 [Candidatus Saccharibacteria bacterium]|nr:hypothetical protein [Candidatus Saccharibacteria bacterium]